MQKVNQSHTKVTSCTEFILTFLKCHFSQKLISDAENWVLTRCILKKYVFNFNWMLELGSQGKIIFP